VRAVLAVALVLFASAETSAQRITTTWIGTDSSWFTGQNWTAGVPHPAIDYVKIDNGGTARIAGAGASAQYVYLGSAVDSSGSMMVSSGGSANFTTLIVGGIVGTGNLTITGGGTVNSFGGPLGSDYLGVGNVVIEGTGSAWNITGPEMVVGGNGAGNLSLTNGGLVRVNNGLGRIQIANHPVSSGIVRIGNGGAPGSISASEIYSGEGTAEVIFDHSHTGYSFSTRMVGAATLEGGFTVRHQGTGTTILGGNHDYAGETVISGGTLLVNGAIRGNFGPVVEDGQIVGEALFAGDVTIESGGALGGTGTIAGKTFNQGRLRPGASAGVLTFDDDLTLEAGGTVTFELGGHVRGTSYDGIDVGGTIQYGGILEIALIDGFLPEDGDTFDLFSGFDSGQGTFDGISVLAAGLNGVFNPSTGVLTWVAIPEPSSSCLLMLGLSFSLGRWRYRSALRSIPFATL
jgi:T5SS/PEP-CTERM-associated repeat protein/autotransporter-associated beta strand protein